MINISHIGKYCHVFAGRDYCRQMDAEIHIGICPIGAPVVGQLMRYRLYFSASWNWLPTVIKMGSGSFYGDARHDSYGWTGVRWHAVGIEWPRQATLRLRNGAD